MRKPTLGDIVALAVAAAMLAALVWLISPARAHDWYDPACCSGMDCAPVEATTFVAADPAALPNMVVTIKRGTGTVTAIVPPNFPRRASKDGRTHACIICNSGGWPSCRLQCLYVPPNT